MPIAASLTTSLVARWDNVRFSFLTEALVLLAVAAVVGRALDGVRSRWPLAAR